MYQKQRRMKRCNDCGQSFDGKSSLCEACFNKRPQCKGKYCNNKTAPCKNGSMEYFSYCQGCACKTQGCKSAHKSDSDYCDDCECPNCKQYGRLNDSDYCQYCCCKSSTCRDQHLEKEEYCAKCLDQVSPTCNICKQNRSTPGYKTCTSCHQRACVSCGKKGAIFDIQHTLCKKCKCIASECGKERLLLNDTGERALYCDYCFHNIKCSSTHCNRFRGTNTDVCAVCFEQKEAPICQRQGCDRRVGKNEGTDQFYQTCMSCKCATPGCTHPRHQDKNICQECVTKSNCKATGCRLKVLQPIESYCNLCLYQWSRGYQKCYNEECNGYTKQPFTYCRSCNDKSKGRQPWKH